MAISWKTNKDCPLCTSALGDDADVLPLPTALFPGLGKPYGDFLREGDPLAGLCGKKVHRRCFDAWPERPRFAAAYIDWMEKRLDGDPERGTAFRDEALVVSAPCDPDDPDAQIVVLDRRTTVTRWIPNREWSASVLPAFPTPRSLAAAIDWTSKTSSCRICMKKLGTSPLSPVAFRVPVSAAWTILDPARPMRQYLGTLVHTECYVAWPKRPLFAATLTDIRYRIAKLSGQACAYSDAHSIVLLDPEGHLEITLRSTGTTVRLPPPASLRPFEKEALDEAMRQLPSVESMAAAIDWTAKAAERATAREEFLVQLRELPIRARREGVRCPRCGKRVNDLELVEAEEAAGCTACEAALTPLDFGWLP